jgi:hypothetical protein
MPEENIFDRILRFFGKRRGAIIPVGAYKEFGDHVYIRARKENFWKALLRPGHRELPEDMLDLYSVSDIKSNLEDE